MYDVLLKLLKVCINADIDSYLNLLKMRDFFKVPPDRDELYNTEYFNRTHKFCSLIADLVESGQHEKAEKLLNFLNQKDSCLFDFILSRCDELGPGTPIYNVLVAVKNENLIQLYCSAIKAKLAHIKTTVESKKIAKTKHKEDGDAASGILSPAFYGSQFLAEIFCALKNNKKLLDHFINFLGQEELLQHIDISLMQYSYDYENGPAFGRILAVLAESCLPDYFPRKDVFDQLLNSIMGDQVRKAKYAKALATWSPDNALTPNQTWVLETESTLAHGEHIANVLMTLVSKPYRFERVVNWLDECNLLRNLCYAFGEKHGDYLKDLLVSSKESFSVMVFLTIKRPDGKNVLSKLDLGCLAYKTSYEVSSLRVSDGGGLFSHLQENRLIRATKLTTEYVSKLSKIFDSASPAAKQWGKGLLEDPSLESEISLLRGDTDPHPYLSYS